MKIFFQNKFLILFFISHFVSAQVDISIPDTTTENSKSVEIPVYVSDLSGMGIRSYEFRLKFDNDILNVKSVTDKNTLSDQRFWNVDAFLNSGDLVVQARGWFPLSGSGKLIIIKFDILAEEGSSDLIFDNFLFNNGSPSNTTKNGSFTIYSEKLISFLQNGNGSGKLKINYDLYDLPFEMNLVTGKNYQITAVPDNGNDFTQWQGDIQSTNNPFTFYVQDNSEIIANFSLKVLSVSALIVPDNSGNVEGLGIYNYGDDVTLKANSYSGKKFVNWTKNGEVISDNPEYTFTVFDNLELVANFTNNLFLVSTVSNPMEGGQISGAGYYYIDESAILTANSNNGWKFINWTENDNIVSEDSVLILEVNSDRILEANFEVVTSIHSDKELMVNTKLFNPYPNPFNPSTLFKFEIADLSEVTLIIYDITGKTIVELYNAELLNSGFHSKLFDGSKLSSGVYFYKFIANDISNKIHTNMGKLVLIK